MEIDQLIYGKIASFIKRIRRKPGAAEVNRTFTLEPNKSVFTILARALTGKAIEVVTAEREGGWKNDRFFLPAKLGLLPTKEENERLYWFRVFYLSTLVNHHEGSQSPIITQPMNVDSEMNKINLIRIFDEFPPLEEMYNDLKKGIEAYAEQRQEKVDYSWLFGKWMVQEDIGNDGKKDLDTDLAQSKADSIETEIKAKPVDEVTSLQVDQKKQEDYTLTHNFEKVDTAEEFSGSWRDFDGDDELQKHEEALDEMTMKNTVRVDDQVHSVYQSEFISNAMIPESGEIEEPEAVRYSYDEWEYKKRTYLKDYCSVYAQLPQSRNDKYVENTLSENSVIRRNLRKQFAVFFNDLKRVRKLNQGEELDIDCLTDFIFDVKAATTPDDRVYSSQRKRQKDISILFLLDLSLSSDGYANGNRIIDIEKQVVLLMGELLSEYDISFQVDGFNSKTRNHCAYYTFKSFKDDWNRHRAKVAAATPEGYTRIGPAVRHAKALMEREDARSKWIVVLSDGKPNDYDKYEGKHGIADVKQAIRELKTSDISIHTFAIEEKAKFYLPLIFGKSDFNVLSNPKEMLQNMSSFCQKIINQ